MNVKKILAVINATYAVAKRSSFGGKRKFAISMWKIVVLCSHLFQNNFNAFRGAPLGPSAEGR